MTQTYSIRRGDTLTSLAKKFGTSVDALAKANNIKDPDRIKAGSTLKVPDGFDGAKAEAKGQVKNGGDVFEQKPTQTQQTQGTTQTQTTNGTTRADNATWRDETTGANYPSRNGTPLYGQADPAWATQDLGTGKNNNNIASAGCAISACAMAVSKMSGKTITPSEMDRYLDKNGGYSGDAVVFGKTGNIAGTNPPVVSTRRTNLGMSEIDKELAAGRPVVIGVDYKNGKGTDHWMTITGKNADGTYNVNDPAGGADKKGRMIRMEVRNGVLQSADAQSNGSQGRPYKFDGNAVTFKGGNPQSGPQTTAPTTTSQSQPTQSKPTTQTNAPTTVSADKSTGRANDLSGAWKAAKGVDANQYDSLIRQSAEKYGIPPRLLKAMIQQESHFNKNAQSGAGAKGLVQIMPPTWKELGGGDPFDPKTNIDHSAKYMSQLLKRYGGDMPKALAAYNYGMGNLEKKMPKGSPLPMAKLPAETRGYVTNIMNSYNGVSYK